MFVAWLITYILYSFVYFSVHNNGRYHTCMFLIRHPIYNDWTVNWYGCLCKLCMSSVEIFREHSKVLLFLVLLDYFF